MIRLDRDCRRDPWEQSDTECQPLQRWRLRLFGDPYSTRLSKIEKMADFPHESYMRLCLKLAGIARERGEVPVGSVIVRDGSVIAEGIEGVRAQHDIARHAEMEAIRRTCEILQTLDLSGCALYTNAEP